MKLIRMHYMHVYNCQKANVIFQKPIKLATGINVTMKQNRYKFVICEFIFLKDISAQFTDTHKI